MYNKQRGKAIHGGGGKALRELGMRSEERRPYGPRDKR
jgi:hypothetical protein